MQETQETCVQSLGREDPLEEEMATHSSIIAWDGKTIALTSETFVGKVMSLLFNMLSRLVIAFLPRSKHLLFFLI